MQEVIIKIIKSCYIKVSYSDFIVTEGFFLVNLKPYSDRISFTSGGG